MFGHAHEIGTYDLFYWINGAFIIKKFLDHKTDPKP